MKFLPMVTPQRIVPMMPIIANPYRTHEKTTEFAYTARTTLSRMRDARSVIAMDMESGWK